MEMLEELIMGSSAHPLNLHQTQLAFKIKSAFILRASTLKARSCSNCATAAASLQSESNGFGTPQYIRCNLQHRSSDFELGAELLGD